MAEPAVRTPLAVGALGAAATSYVAAVDPNRPGHYPLCPFKAITGWWCPACGGLRCVHALTRGDLPAAAHDNALALIAIAAALALWTRWTVNTARHRPAPLRLPRGAALALTALALVFTVARNLPGGAALAP